ncbi:MAG TPA: SUMF1/EgtB/PvdO family nonheme iron enzyme, partial [Polyangiaceae bacterium]
MRTKLALLAGVALMVACSLVVDLDPLRSTGDAQTMIDSGLDACPTGTGGPSMVRAGSFCIDQTEVTNAQYHDFVAANPPTSDQPAECAWNGSWVPFSGQWTYQNTTASYPITGVNWCQAYMFCKWAGKHLCGAPDGGSATSWASSAYYSACSHGGAHVFPYGDALDAGACNGVEGGAD